jgi:hypothetical protein
MQLQIIPMPIPIPYPIYDSYGGTRPNTTSENLAILSVILSIYILWIFSFLVTYIIYKNAMKNADRYYFREYRYGYLRFRSDSLHMITDPIMIIGIISFIIYLLIK